MVDPSPLYVSFDSQYVKNVCGGFYIDNLDTAGLSQSTTNNINNIYANSQVLLYTLVPDILLIHSRMTGACPAPTDLLWRW